MFIYVNKNRNLDHVIPVCNRARLFCKLTGTNMLSPEDLKVIRELEFTPKLIKEL